MRASGASISASDVWAQGFVLAPSLVDLGLMWFKRAVTLGADTTDGVGAITHGVRGSALPLHTLLETGNVTDNDTGSEGIHDIGLLNAMPDGLQPDTLIFEAKIRGANSTNSKMFMGFRRGASAQEDANSCASIFFDGGVSATNLICRSHDGVGEEQTDSGVALHATNFMVLRIEVTASTVVFKIDGVTVATHSTRVPDTGLVADSMYAGIVLRTMVNAVRTAYYEYVAVWSE